MAKGNFLTGGIFVGGETPVLKSDVVVPANQALQQTVQQPIAQPKPVMLAQNDTTENSPMFIAPIDTQNLPNNIPSLGAPIFPGPYAPNSIEINNYEQQFLTAKNELAKDPVKYAYDPGKWLSAEDLKQISSSYATDKNYIDGLLRGQNLIAGLELNPTKKVIADKIVQTAIDNGANPRLVLSQVLHETSNFTRLPNNNPGGVKPSKVTKQYIKDNPDIADSIVQIQSTREAVPSSASGLQNMFENPKTKFVLRESTQKDIKNLTQDEVDILNETLDTARKTGKWNNLALKIKELKEQYPYNSSTKVNQYFWVSQPFMKYPDIESATQDIIRAHTGKEDTSTWNIDSTTARLQRTMPNGKKVLY